jgi:hypothetical protein
VPANRGTFIDELTAAGRGVIALTVGNRRAPEYFDLTRVGLVGSFVGLLAIAFISAIVPLLLPGASDTYSIARSTLMAVILFVFQIGFSIIVLRQVGRMDGLVPYMVADNWASVFISALQLLLSVVGLDNQVTFFALSVLVIVVEINICRLILTLPPLQIAMFMVAQLVGVSLALLLIGMIFPGAAAITAA